MAILREFFLLLELRDRVSATAETYQKKLIRRFKTAKEENKLRGGSSRVVQDEIDKEQYLDAAKAIINYFAEHDPTKQNRYLDWITRQFIKGHLLWEDAFKMRKLLDDFEKYRKKLSKKDLNQYDSYQDLEEALEPLRGTEVAGVRVQNFLNKADVQKFRDSEVADPAHPYHKEDYEALHGDEDTRRDVPSWFEDQLHDSASEFASESVDFDEYEDAARDDIDKDDFTDEDGEFDEEAYDDAVRDEAQPRYESALEQYVEEYVRENSQHEWEQYLDSNQEGFEQNLQNSRNKTPELNVVYDNDRLAVMVPNSKEAACFIGKGTEWCTAAEESDNYWWEYAQEGPLYAVVTDKIGKFQFHFHTHQFMDEHDRYIEDSSALENLVKRYPKELEEAFGKVADDNMEWWLLPVTKTPAEAWDKFLEFSSGNSEDPTRDVVRQWQAHGHNAPEGWADQVRKNILGGSQSEKAIKYGWVGKIESHEGDEIIKTGLKNHTINAYRAAEHVAMNNIDISKESWAGLMAESPEALFYAPLEFIDREILDRLNKRTIGKGYTRTSFLDDFYSRFKHLKDKDEKLRKQDTDDEFTPELTSAEQWVPHALERARRMAGLITMDDVVKSTLAYPDTLTKFKMDFGMKPWMAVAHDAMAKGEEDVQRFVHMATSVVRNNDEPWAKDIVNLIHQMTTHHPQVASQTFQYPQDDLPPDTENAILDYIARNVDPKSRANIARQIQGALDNYNTGGQKEIRLSPEAAEVMRAYRNDNEIAIQRARERVPAQQQLEM